MRTPRSLISDRGFDPGALWTQSAGPPTLARSIGIVAALLILLGIAIGLLALIHLPMLR